MSRRPFPVVLLPIFLLIAAADPDPKEPPFEKEIRAFEEADKAAPPAPGGIVFVGSSSIRLWKTLKEDFRGLRVINRGFGGSQAEHATLHADRIVIPYKPKTVVFYSGDNDLNAGKSPEQVRDDYAAFIAKVRTALPETKFVILAVKPSVARVKLLDKQRQANRLLRQLAERDPEHLTFVDVFTPMLGEDGQPRGDLLVDDKLHMNAEGYKIWTALLKPVLN